MRNTIFVIVAMATSGLVQAQNQVQKLRLEVSSGEYGSCDMQPFTGSISIKVTLKYLRTVKLDPS